jgi:hypothetical protein
VRYAFRCAGIAPLACAMLLVAGCAAARYEKVRLGETAGDALPKMLGPAMQRLGPWRYAGYEGLVPLEISSVAVSVDGKGATRAKALCSMTFVHWLLFITADLDQRVELRVDAETMERLVQKQSGRDLIRLLLSWESWNAETQPTTNPLDQWAASLPIKEESAARVSPEQVPVALLLSLQFLAPTSLFGQMLYASAESEEPSEGAAGAGILSFAMWAGGLGESGDALLAAAEAQHLYTAPAPLEIKVGNWRILKHDAGWYELRQHYGEIAPAWGSPRDSGKRGEPATSQPAPEDTTTSAPSAD